MRLLITAPWRERLGGAENMLWSFLRHADRERLQVSVAALEPGPFSQDLARLPGIEVLDVPIGRLRDAAGMQRSVRALARLVRSLEPDLVLNWVTKAQLYGAPAAMLAGRSERVVWWQHGVPHGHWMDRAATALPAAAVGCSSAASASAQARQRPRRPTFVVHPGVDPDTGAPESRHALGIPDGRILLGIVGRLQPWKGQEHFLRALALLVARGHDVHGLVVGGDAHGLSPGYAASLAGLPAALGLADRVTLTGQVADPRPYLGVMDVLVSASQHEPFGIVLLEAMAQSVPVVAVAQGGPVEIVRDGLTGVLAPERTPQALAGAIEVLLADRDRRRMMGRAGRELLLAEFTSQRMALRLEEALIRIERGEAPAAAG